MAYMLNALEKKKAAWTICAYVNLSQDNVAAEMLLG